ncbi:hypothetical protein [Undibacterium sp.]|uniref:hypothetical protein n=1 Tax=Undibacterium sp. TaxID=1914977 RepID=UPI00374DC548
MVSDRSEGEKRQGIVNRQMLLPMWVPVHTLKNLILRLEYLMFGTEHYSLSAHKISSPQPDRLKKNSSLGAKQEPRISVHCLAHALFSASLVTMHKHIRHIPGHITDITDISGKNRHHCIAYVSSHVSANA